MSNKTQLQTNNTKYASLIEILRGKAAGGSGEDVTDETNAYTTKLASLETAVAALETELEGKASGGSGGASIETCEVTITNSNSTFLCFMYNNEDGAVYQTNPLATIESATITIRKNSALVIFCANFLPSITCSSEIVYLGDGGANSHIKAFTFSINGDGAITVCDDD